MPIKVGLVRIETGGIGIPSVLGPFGERPVVVPCGWDPHLSHVPAAGIEKGKIVIRRFLTGALGRWVVRG